MPSTEHPREEPPDQAPAAPLLFGHVLREGGDDLEERLTVARERWWRAVERLEGAPVRAWAWRFPRIPPVLRGLVGVVCLWVGAAGIARAPLDDSARQGPVAPATVTRAEVLQFVNGASEAELLATGVYRRGVRSILAARPFASWEALDHTPGIGPRTLQALRRGAERKPGL